jgi:hypothetical protein
MQPGESPRRTIQPVRVGDVEFYVSLVERGGPETINVRDAFDFAGVRRTLEAVAGEIDQAWQKVKPTEATVEFGLALTAKSGKLTGLVVEGGAAANFKVTMVWKKPDQG